VIEANTIAARTDIEERTGWAYRMAFAIAQRVAIANNAHRSLLPVGEII
jgi:hypothetical protein